MSAAAATTDTLTHSPGHSPSSKRIMARRNRQSRGVILLVVLGILALFALVGVVYVISSGQHNAAVRNEIRGEQVGDPPDALLHAALQQVLAGSRNKTSALQTHSLLEDMYGNDAVRGTIPNISNPQAVPGRMLEMVFIDGVTASPADDYNDYYSGCVLTMTGGRAAGRSALVVSYEQIGGNNRPQMRMRVMPFPGLATHHTFYASDVATGDPFLINGRPFNGTGFGLSNVAVSALQPTDPNAANLLLNAYDPWSTVQVQNGLLQSPWELALLPHPAFFRPANRNAPLNPQYALNYLDPTGPGGADEDYDAADFQNMLLAARMSTTFGGVPRVVVAIPSLHRPELSQYWMNRAVNDFSLTVPPNTPLSWETLAPLGASAAAQDAIRELARRSSLRPSTLDHFQDLPGGTVGVRDANEPDFAGKFPIGSALGPTYDPMWPSDQNGDNLPDGAGWDVDNDGDGEADSVWVDLGFPVQRRPDGTLYKPLFAILVVDLDGKLNLNAHTTINHLADAAGQAAANAATLSGSVQLNVVGPLAANAQGANPGSRPINLPLGSGYGPPEINLHVLTDDPLAGSRSGRPANNNNSGVTTVTALGDLGRLLMGAWDSSTNTLTTGRYGDPQSAPAVGGAFNIATQGPRPHQWFVPSPRDVIARRDMADAYFATNLLAGIGAYGLPPDLDGDGVMCLDLRGQPYFANLGDRFGHGETQEKVNNPYDFDLSRLTSPAEALFNGQIEPTDAPFTAADFERVLRFADIDAQALPDRLFALAPHLFQYDPLDAFPTLASYRRNLVTFASFDLPSPSVLPPIETVWDDPGTSTDRSVFDTDSASHPINQPGATRLTDLLRARIIEANSGSAATVLVNASIKKLLSPECRANQKFNVNRPFGDGFDNTSNQLVNWNANGVVDEAEESYPPQGGNAQPAWPNTQLQATFDANNDGVIDYRDLMPGVRGEYARHLMVLALLTADKRFDAPVAGNNFSQAETVRRAAQWAVNVVDYRDRDGIMTPFEFDLEPFKDNDGDPDNGTWDVDGIIGVNPATGVSDDHQPWRAVVWGCERPEALITETLALHDRRLEDTDEEVPNGATTTATMNPDEDLDQARPPEGSLWVELYNPWRAISGDSSDGASSFLQDQPAEMWSRTNSGIVGLDLSKLSQDPPPLSGGMPAQSPVFRLAIQEDATGVGSGDFPDPDDETDAGNAANNARLTRFVYFHSNSTPGILRPPLGPNQRNFFLASQGQNTNPNTPVILPPGQYLVCGPPGTPGYPTARRPPGGGPTPVIPGQKPAATIIGKHLNYQNGGAQAINNPIMYQTRRIELVPNDNFSSTAPFPPLLVWGFDPGQITHTLRREYPQDSEIERPLAYQFESPSANGGLRLSVSEPQGGYPPADNGTHGYSIVLDQALDIGPMFGPADAPLQNGIREGYFMVHLQRLANPLRRYDPLTNPYRTIDSMPVDVCVFNGEQAPSGRPETFDNFMLLSRQRGDAVPALAGGSAALPKGLAFWLQEPIRREGTSPYAQKAYTPAAADQHVFKWPLGHSLGYVNFDWTIDKDWNDVPWPNPLDAENWIGSALVPLGAGVPAPIYGPFTTPNSSFLPMNYRGVRRDPTPWMAWANRPFVSGNELMNVPATRSSRLLNPGTFKRGPQSPASAAPFAHRAAAHPDDYAGDPWGHLEFMENTPNSRFNMDLWNRGPSFPHLLNFFQTKRDTTPGGIPSYNNATGQAPQWHRLLDYMHVPSRFIGTETFLSRAAFDVGITAPGAHEFYPPNNRLSNYREPGKINLNTVFDDGQTWKALVGYVGPNVPDGFPSWNEVRRSRSGVANTSTDAILPSADTPTRFANPFRSAAGTHYVPIERLKLSTAGQPRDPIDTGLLRSLYPNAYNGGQTQPLLQYARATTPGNVPDPTAPVDTNTNPNFRNLLLQKLGNLVTTRSNVYAVWITVGYFEVERVPPAQQFDSNGRHRYPDGFRLRREVGIDSGQIERHRAFYLIDRTIPAAFERGETHNVENCVLLRRFIE